MWRDSSAIASAVASPASRTAPSPQNVSMPPRTTSASFAVKAAYLASFSRSALPGKAVNALQMSRASPPQPSVMNDHAADHLLMPSDLMMSVIFAVSFPFMFTARIIP